MTERRVMEQFEARFADRVREYTDPATERRIDALAVSRTAMSSQRATGWSLRRLGAGLLGRRIARVRSAVAVAAVVIIGVVGIAVIGRPSDSAGGPIPDVLRHSWQRPLPVVAGEDQWGTGSLRLAPGIIDFGPISGAATSRSAITADGLDMLVVTATVETRGCAIGDIGAYRWSVKGKGTVMTLTAIGADACAARDVALAGQWVRSDLPLPRDVEATLPPGTYLTSAFDPFGRPGASGQLSYTVPEGWKVKEDVAATFVLHHLPDAPPGQPSTDTFLFLFARPRLAAEFPDGAICGPFGNAAGVGRGVDDIVAAIRARPGVTSTPPAVVTVDGLEGQLIDLRLAPDWTGACLAPEGLIVGVPILVAAGTGVGLGPDHPLRLILLDLGGGRTMSIAIQHVGPPQSSPFDEQLAEVMPIIEGFEFQRPPP